MSYNSSETATISGQQLQNFPYLEKEKYEIWVSWDEESKKKKDIAKQQLTEFSVTEEEGLAKGLLTGYQKILEPDEKMKLNNQQPARFDQKERYVLQCPSIGHLLGSVIETDDEKASILPIKSQKLVRRTKSIGLSDSMEILVISNAADDLLMMGISTRLISGTDN
ncbi:hypothetical protein Tco_1006325 [Tanacetum coccineum]|uniref:Uncharacterized protein n=1 Tax=Tanacetum coccineum TaxID=301880 RepID=A0ABQ5FHN5_9ASTR